MTGVRQQPADRVTANLELAGSDWRFRAQLTVPTGPTRWRQLLPMVQELTDAAVAMATRRVEEQGKEISCRKGCGACCRQLVPVSQTEARQLAELIEQLPEPRRTQVHDRFTAARCRLAEAGLLDRLKRQRQWSAQEVWPLGLEYFHLGIACPFLEDEVCSIYADRPTPCREYLVTSPAANCAQPTPETVQCVPTPLKVSTALARADGPTDGQLHWVPLILAPEWAQAHPDEPPARPGPQFVEALVKRLTGKEVPQA